MNIWFVLSQVTLNLNGTLYIHPVSTEVRQKRKLQKREVDFVNIQQSWQQCEKWRRSTFTSRHCHFFDCSVEEYGMWGNQRPTKCIEILFWSSLYINHWIPIDQSIARRFESCHRGRYQLLWLPSCNFFCSVYAQRFVQMASSHFVTAFCLFIYQMNNIELIQKIILSLRYNVPHCSIYKSLI